MIDPSGCFVPSRRSTRSLSRAGPRGSVLGLSILLCLLAPLMAAPLPALGQQAAGDVELQFVGSLLTTVGQDNGSETQGLFQAKAGYFLTDRIEVGAFPSLTLSRTTIRSDDWPDVPDQSSSETKVGMGVFSTYSFLTAGATTVPYVGGQFYRIDVTNEDEGGWLGVNAGLKFYLSERTAFDTGGNALMGVGQSEGVLLHLQVGLSFLL